MNTQAILVMKYDLKNFQKGRNYRKVSNIRRTKYQNSNASRLIVSR